MLNKDINSRFEDWLLNPTETLDFEAKRWLDMSDPESHGLVAKALIALENHGGGFLLFGYKEDEDKKLVPDTNRPNSLQPYLTDAINAILKKRAEPVFHVEVTLQKHPVTGDEYPLVRVAGRSKVPVRSDSATAGGSLKQHLYYIRAAGPESRGPIDASEWDALLRRAILMQREEIVGVLRAFLPDPRGGNAVSSPTEREKLEQFVKTSKERWATLNESLPLKHPGRIEQGYFALAARIIGTTKGLSFQQILDANQSLRRYTGWPAFITVHQEDVAPKLVDGAAEAWLAKARTPDVGHADYWRINREGDFFLLRGYQEDSLDPSRGFGEPGALFEVTLPVWRVGEFLLRVNDLGAAMFEDGFEVLVQCEWTGLEGRRLFVHNNRRYVPRYLVSQDVVRTSGTFSQAVLGDLLPDAVKVLVAPLLEHFELFTPPDSFYTEELAEMRKNSF